MYCEHGFEVDENGCEICHCKTRREYTTILIGPEFVGWWSWLSVNMFHTCIVSWLSDVLGELVVVKTHIKNWPIRLPILSRCLEPKQCSSFAGLGYTSLVQWYNHYQCAFLSLSQATGTCTYYSIYHGLFYVYLIKMRGDRALLLLLVELLTITVWTFVS